MDKSYAAASYDEIALQGFDPYTLPSDNELQYFDRYTVISRCRYLEANNDLAKAIVDCFASHTIGGGLTPQIVGNTKIEAEFKNWCKNHTFGNYKSFYQLQELVLRTVLVSGDILINTIFDDDEMYIQLIEPERITNPFMGVNTTTMRNGVEINQYNEPINYHILSAHPAEPTGYTNYILPAKMNGNTLSWLVFKPRRPDQHRGIPIFAASLKKFAMLDSYLHNELVASVVSSNFTTFIESIMGDGYNPLGAEQDKTMANGDTVKQIKMRPGMILKLSPGEKVTTANPTRPNPQMENFVLIIVNFICASTGLSREVVMQQFSSNYSASKAAMAQSWKTISYWRRLIIDFFCTPIYELWCKYNGYDVLPIEWQGTSRVILDDAKEVSAAVERVNLGISSRKEECEELRGRDWEVTNNYLQREKELGYGDAQQQVILDEEEFKNGDVKLYKAFMSLLSQMKKRKSEYAE